MIWIVDFLSRFIHVATAITLVGGSAFMLLVLIPSAKQLTEESHDQLSGAVIGRWKPIVHIGIALFLASGLYNYIRAIDDHRGDTLYHALIGTKMLIALAVFFVAAALVGRSEKLEPIRKNRARWLRILVLMATVIVAISGFVKVRGEPHSAVVETEVSEPPRSGIVRGVAGQ